MSPRKLFLVDSLGALLSTILLGGVLPRFEAVLGMPASTLHFLAAIAAVLFSYSFGCYRMATKNWRPFMKFLGIANLLYCVLTAGIMIYLSEKITIWGVTYFILEIMVIVALAVFELRLAANRQD